MHQLPLSEDTEGYVDESFPLYVNNAGQVAGHRQQFSSDTPVAFRYDGTPGAGGQLRLIGSVPSFAHGINNAGSVVGSITWNSVNHAFRYDGAPFEEGTLQDLGTLGGLRSTAYGINDLGQVVGYSLTANGSTRAFLYEGEVGHAGTMYDLGVPSPEYSSSSASAINSSGVIVGTADHTSSQNSIPFRYEGRPGAGGQMRVMESFGYSAGVAAINEAGFAVGTIHMPNPSGISGSTLWRTDGTAINLDAWLDAIDPIEGAHWSLRTLRDISESSLVTGYGMRDGRYSAFALDVSSLVPEPATLFVLPLMLLAFRRAR